MTVTVTVCGGFLGSLMRRLLAQTDSLEPRVQRVEADVGAAVNVVNRHVLLLRQLAVAFVLGLTQQLGARRQRLATHYHRLPLLMHDGNGRRVTSLALTRHRQCGRLSAVVRYRRVHRQAALLRSHRLPLAFDHRRFDDVEETRRLAAAGHAASSRRTLHLVGVVFLQLGVVEILCIVADGAIDGFLALDHAALRRAGATQRRLGRQPALLRGRLARQRVVTRSRDEAVVRLELPRQRFVLPLQRLQRPASLLGHGERLAVLRSRGERHHGGGRPAQSLALQLLHLGCQRLVFNRR